MLQAMQKRSPQPTAERARRHRPATRLEQVRDDLEALKRDVKALMLGRLDYAAESQRERPQ
ncbi:MAG: hypothetical protein K0R41_1063 [Geminicoccaceae bacterium]|jgi:hypothetical protein|nr:hypothetical protein [Geminicoccaceae bacterium]